MILFFDTETTGLPKNWKAPVTDLDNWPRLVQLAYLVYDFDGNLIHSCNEIIKPEGFTIPLESSNVHGITAQIALQRGNKIADVLELFQIHLKRANLLVAHNMSFDEKIVGAELLRLGSQNIIEQKEKICTMLETIDFCAIEGPYGYKWPKLDELHRKLFGFDFEGAHDALADIQATAKCFWELKEKNLIKFNPTEKYTWINQKKSKDDEKIKNLIDEAIKNKRKSKITYINLKNETSERVILDLNYSMDIIHKPKIDSFNLNDFNITGFCLFRNEQRTFNIKRIISFEILPHAESHLDLFENDFIIPLYNISGQGSWKLFSISQCSEIEVFSRYWELQEFCKKFNIKYLKTFEPIHYYSDVKGNYYWNNWEIKWDFDKNSSRIEQYDLYYKGKIVDKFKKITEHYVPVIKEENEDSFAGFKIYELSELFAVIVKLDSYPPDDWDDWGITAHSEIIFIDKNGKLYFESLSEPFEWYI